jgi:hypothetical protein
MNNNDIPVKTVSGTEEVSKRSRKLPPRLRTLLIMVDGGLTAAQLRQAAATLGAPADCLESLESMGLVEVQSQAPAQAPAPAQAGHPAAEPPAAERAPAPTQPVPAMTDPERFRAAQKFMNDNAVDALGLRAFFFTLKMEKCYTCDDLRALLPEFTRLVTKGSGEAVARVLTARAREILN